MLPGDVARIVVADRHNPTVRFAAKELRKYVRRVTGADLPVVHDESATPPGSFVLRLEGNAAEDRFGLRADPRKKQVTITGSNPRSVLFGVYGFLKEFLGVRWLRPGRGGEMLERKPLVAIPRMQRAERALLKYRGFYVDTGQFSITPENIGDVVDWMAKNYGNYLLVSVVFYDWLKEPLVTALKLRGLMLEVGHHGFDFYLDHRKTFRRHPEWFSMINGRRTPGHFLFNMIHDSQLCSTNEAGLRSYADALKRYLDANPEVDVLGIIPNDGFGWCECPRCLKLEKSERQSPLRHPLQAGGRRTMIGSRRYHRIVQHVAERVGTAYPDRLFSFWAYAGVILPSPAVRRLPDNFLLTLALYERWYSDALDDPRVKTVPEHANAKLAKILDQWRDAFRGDILIYEYYAKYAWLSLPKWIPDLLRKDTRFFRRRDIQGVLSMVETDPYPVYEPNYLAQLAMSWSASVSSDRWLDDYAASAFRTTAPQVKAKMRDVIRLMKPFAMPGPPYPRSRTFSAAKTSADLATAFRELTAQARGDRSIAPASRRTLAAWAKSMELTRQRFLLNELYYELDDTLRAKQYEEALRVLKKWRVNLDNFFRSFRGAFGSGAVLSDRCWLERRSAAIDELENSVRKAIAGKLDAHGIASGGRNDATYAGIGLQRLHPGSSRFRL